MATTTALIPAITPPPGQYAFSGGNVLEKWAVVTVSVCLATATIPFILRVYIRGFVIRQWIFEDYMACIAWGGLCAYSGLVATVMVLHHGGTHEWNLTKEQVQSVFYWFNLASIIYGVEVLICKLTIVMIYRRVFVPHRWSAFDILLRLFEAAVVMFYISITLVKIFECTPRPRIWNKAVPGVCINVNTMLQASGMFNFVTDCLILLIPVKAVWSLKMKRSRKVRVVLVFTFGLIAPIFSMIGFLVREQIAKNTDSTYGQPLVLLWGSAEVTTGMICISLPPLSIIFNRKSSSNGPTKSIINGDSNKGQASVSRMKRKSNMDIDDEDLLNADYIELKDGSTYTVGGVEKPKRAFVTGITAGEQESGHDRSQGDISDNSMDNVIHGHGRSIVKTVRVEQSYE